MTRLTLALVLACTAAASARGQYVVPPHPHLHPAFKPLAPHPLYHPMVKPSDLHHPLHAAAKPLTPAARPPVVAPKAAPVKPHTVAKTDARPTKSARTAPAQKPAVQVPAAYALSTKPAKRIEALLTYDVFTPQLQASEWQAIVAKPPDLPGQQAVRVQVSLPVTTVTEQGPLRRSVLYARVAGALAPQRLSVQVRYEAVLMARQLVPLGQGPRPSAAATVQGAADGQKCLAPSTLYDYPTPAFQLWLRSHGLVRGPREQEVDFARRVFLTIARTCSYRASSLQDRRASNVCRDGWSDCGGLSGLFVTALRANQVPARSLIGRNAESALPGGELIGDIHSYQHHVVAEFYARGLSWVPVDMAGGVSNRSDPLSWFGNSSGYHFAMHVDPEIHLEGTPFGTVPALQGIDWRVVGDGTVQPQQTQESWTVRVLP